MGLKVVSQTCGDKGTMKLLIHCMECDSAVHLYCLKIISFSSDNITWKCEDCAPKVSRVGPARKSDRITLKNDRSFEVRSKWKKRLNKNSNRSSTAKRPACVKEEPVVTTQQMGKTYLTEELFEIAQQTGTTCVKKELTEIAQQIGNFSSQVDVQKRNYNSLDERLIKRRRVFLEEMDKMVEDFQSVKAQTFPFATHSHCHPLSISYGHPSLGSPNKYAPAQPVMEPIWRGTCTITNRRNEPAVGLFGHLSSKACTKVSDAVTLLPGILDVAILPRCDVWPKSFESSSPTDESIALYFFPESQRDERVFDGLLEKIIEQNLAMKAMTNDLELLVFSSLELPQQLWRFRRKYYLWGVFRQKQSSPNVPSSNVQCITHSKYSNQGVRKGLPKTMTTWRRSPNSLLSNYSSHLSNSPNSHFHPKAKCSPSNSISSHSSKLTRLDKAAQGICDQVQDLKMRP